VLLESGSFGKNLLDLNASGVVLINAEIYESGFHNGVETPWALPHSMKSPRM